MTDILSRIMLALVPIFVAIPAQAQSDVDIKSIEAVFADYVGGLEKGDLARLSRAFSPEGFFVAVKAAKDGMPAMIVSRPFKDVLGSWAESPDPTASGRITGITVQNEFMASIQAELDLGADRYEDHLLLYKLDGRWWIVAKTTYGRDRPKNSTSTTSKE